MSSRTAGRIKIPQWAVVSRTVTAWDILNDVYDAFVSKSRTDLTTATVYFTLRDADDNVILQKDSDTLAEITILNQLVEATKGQAQIFFVEADTAGLTVGATYWFDVWVAVDGKEEPIVDRGKFIVCKSETQISLV